MAPHHCAIVLATVLAALAVFGRGIKELACHGIAISVWAPNLASPYLLGAANRRAHAIAQLIGHDTEELAAHDFDELSAGTVDRPTAGRYRPRVPSFSVIACRSVT
jgi:hypothetical protein